MKLLLRLWHEINTLQSWIFDGEPHIDGHDWQLPIIIKEGNRYREIDTCSCGKTTECWMDEITYLRMKHLLPKLTTKERV